MTVLSMLDNSTVCIGCIRDRTRVRHSIEAKAATGTTTLYIIFCTQGLSVQCFNGGTVDASSLAFAVNVAPDLYIHVLFIYRIYMLPI